MYKISFKKPTSSCIEETSHESLQACSTYLKLACTFYITEELKLKEDEFAVTINYLYNFCSVVIEYGKDSVDNLLFFMREEL